MAEEITQQAYWAEVRTMAEDLAREAFGEYGNADDIDEAREYVFDSALHERVDGHQWVIYTHYNYQVLQHSDNDAYSVENFGSESIVRDGVLDTAALAFGALYGDVIGHIEDALEGAYKSESGERFKRAHTRGLEGLEGVSTGPCPGCIECAQEHGFQTTEAFDAALACGEVSAEPQFSNSGCGICGNDQGGDFEAWHFVSNTGQVIHETDACHDCVVYLANGDTPDEWEG